MTPKPCTTGTDRTILRFSLQNNAARGDAGLPGRACLAFLLFGLTCLPLSAFAASLFTGSYQPTFHFDGNLYNNNLSGGLALTQSVGTVGITAGAGANDLNVSMPIDSQQVSVPLVVSGNLATLSTSSYALSNATLLSLNILSDGNNMALAYVTSSGTVANPVMSYATAVWHRNPASGSTSALLGNWQTTTAYGNTNLRSPPYNFQSQPTGCCSTVTATNGNYQLSYVDSQNATVTIPLTVSGDIASASSPPVTTPTSYLQSFNMSFDTNGYGAGALMATELADKTDVAISLQLMSRTAVPLPSTFSLMLSGAIAMGAGRRKWKCVKRHS